jgi:2-polyprenyl-3-methyl-5-hydroxy-6-metoxy-1,4-benzoquinol methylase
MTRPNRLARPRHACHDRRNRKEIIMSSDTWKKLTRDPVGALARLWQKTVVGPLRYRRGADYDAERYWRERFDKYGLSLRGPGDEGLSDQDNAAMYREAADRFAEICAAEGIELAGKSVLEIGVGNGFYAGLLHEAGVASYLGLDITDALFESLRAAHQGFRFAHGDITEDAPDEQFDVVLFIDVIQHIVTPERFSAALQNAASCLKPGGVMLLYPLTRQTKRHLFYVHWWSREQAAKALPEYSFGPAHPFRYADLHAVRRPK